MSVKQVPVDATRAGVYGWTLRLSSQTVTGHVIVRGPNAGPIGNHPFDADSETWFYDAIQSQSNAKQTFELTLLQMATPTDPALDTLVSQVVNDETSMGEAAMIPDWEEGSPLPQNPIVFTMKDVENGPGDYDDLYERVSLVLPVTTAPLMPTWYTDIEGLYSIFGGDAQKGAPVKDGTKAVFVAIDANDDGYPGAGWYWTGRDPS